MLRVGVWNMLHGRDDAEAVDQVLAFMARHQLDAVALGETREYARELRTLARLGFGVVLYDDKPGQADTALIVRPGKRAHAPRIHRMTRRGWFTTKGRRTPPKYAPSCVVDGITLAAVHPAPSVRFPHTGPEGPARRVASTISHRHGETRLLRRTRGPLAIVGDWNAVPDAPGRYSPRWLARRHGLAVIAPTDPTHGRRTIDYAIARGLTGTATVHGRGGSDHRLVVIELRNRKSFSAGETRARLEGKAAAAPKQEIFR